MTDKYIEYKLKDTSNEARDFLAWNSIRAAVRLRNSPHLQLNVDKWNGIKQLLTDEDHKLNIEAQKENDKKNTKQFLELHNAYMSFRDKHS